MPNASHPKKSDSNSINQLIYCSLKQNIKPGLALQVATLITITAYFFHPPTHHFFRQIANLRLSIGLTYAIASTALFGGLIPFLIQQLRPKFRKMALLNQLPFFLFFWGLMGLVVDRFYAFQAYLFGDEASWHIILVKVVIDQGLFSPFIAVPFIALAYKWKDSGYSLKQTRQSLGKKWLHDELVPITLVNAMVWVPTVALVYQLPLDLQLPVQNLVQCFWCILLLFLTQPTSPQSLKEE